MRALDKKEKTMKKKLFAAAAVAVAAVAALCFAACGGKDGEFTVIENEQQWKKAFDDSFGAPRFAIAWEGGEYDGYRKFAWDKSNSVGSDTFIIYPDSEEEYISYDYMKLSDNQVTIYSYTSVGSESYGWKKQVNAISPEDRGMYEAMGWGYLEDDGEIYFLRTFYKEYSSFTYDEENKVYVAGEIDVFGDIYENVKISFKDGKLYTVKYTRDETDYTMQFTYGEAVNIPQEALNASDHYNIP